MPSLSFPVMIISFTSPQERDFCLHDVYITSHLDISRAQGPSPPQQICQTMPTATALVLK